MVGAWVSIQALFNYDNTIFDDMITPDGIDRKVLKDKIIWDNRELGLIYADPIFMKKQITLWSKVKVPIWTKLVNTVNLEYDALSPTDIKRSKADSFIQNKEGGDVNNNSRTIDVTENNGGDENTDNKNLTKNVGEYQHVNTEQIHEFGFNNNEPVLKSSTETDFKGSEEYDEDAVLNEKRKWTHENSRNSRQQDNNNHNYNEWIKNAELEGSWSLGNQGTYTKQELIKQEREVAMFSIYEEISREFKQEFCIQMW